MDWRRSCCCSSAGCFRTPGYFFLISNKLLQTCVVFHLLSHRNKVCSHLPLIKKFIELLACPTSCVAPHWSRGSSYARLHNPGTGKWFRTNIVQNCLFTTTLYVHAVFEACWTTRHTIDDIKQVKLLLKKKSWGVRAFGNQETVAMAVIFLGLGTTNWDVLFQCRSESCLWNPVLTVCQQLPTVWTGFFCSFSPSALFTTAETLKSTAQRHSNKKIPRTSNWSCFLVPFPCLVSGLP